MITRSILKAQYLLSGAWLMALAISLLAVSACGGATPTMHPPAGAAAGLNTFIYFFTEN